VPPQSVRDFQGLFALLAAEGDVEPMFVCLGMRCQTDGQRIQRVKGPVGPRRLAQHLSVEQVCNPLADAPAAVQAVDQTNLKEPGRARFLIRQRSSQRRQARLVVAALQGHTGRLEVEPRGRCSQRNCPPRQVAPRLGDSAGGPGLLARRAPLLGQRGE
jgi:hypothetical protein